MWDYFTRSRALCWSSELGTQQCCRDNETNLLAKIYSVLVVATPFRHETLAFFGTCSCHRSSITLSRCCCRDVIKIVACPALLIIWLGIVNQCEHEEFKIQICHCLITTAAQQLPALLVVQNSWRFLVTFSQWEPSVLTLQDFHWLRTKVVINSEGCFCADILIFCWSQWEVSVLTL